MDTQLIYLFDTIDSITNGKLKGDAARSSLLTWFAVLFGRFLDQCNSAQFEYVVQCIDENLKPNDQFQEHSSVPLPTFSSDGYDHGQTFINLVLHGLLEKIPGECFTHLILFAQYRWLLIRLQPQGVEDHGCDLGKTVAFVLECYVRGLGADLLEKVLDIPETCSYVQKCVNRAIHDTLKDAMHDVNLRREYLHSHIGMTNVDIAKYVHIDTYVAAMIKKFGNHQDMEIDQIVCDVTPFPEDDFPVDFFGGDFNVVDTLDDELSIGDFDIVDDELYLTCEEEIP